MGGARALIASVGASISLVAGASLALFLVSIVVAYEGFTGGSDPPLPSAAYLITDHSSDPPSRGGASRRKPAAVVLEATPVARTAAPARSREPRPARGASAPAKPSFHPGVLELTPPAPAPPVSQTPVAPDPAATGDGVRDVGDVVTATVQGTGAAAGAAATPLLGPPVSQAVQDVLDLLTSVVQGATGTLGGVIDRTLPTRSR